MTQRGEQQIEKLCAEARCPECDYSLRGLSGDIVTCPECGRQVNIVTLVAMGWKGSWHTVPVFYALLYPVAWILVGGFSTFFIWGISLEIYGTYLGGISALIVLTTGWLLMLRSRSQSLENGQAIPLMAFAHVLMVGYLASVLGVISFGMQMYSSWSLAMAILNGLFVFLFLCLFIICRRGEKYIARQCMRQYLINQAGVDTIGT